MKRFVKPGLFRLSRGNLSKRSSGEPSGRNGLAFVQRFMNGFEKKSTDDGIGGFVEEERGLKIKTHHDRFRDGFFCLKF
jgi:hypothetical protein